MSDVNWRSMTMLTYPEKWPNHGGITKDDLNKWLSFARNFAADYPVIVSRETFVYCWFLEWQERGAPHYHVITNLNINSPTFFSTRGRLAYKWAEIAVQSQDKFGKPLYLDTGERMDAWIKVYRVHNHSDNWQQIRKRDGVIRYAAKYAAKSQQKDVPAGFVNPGRFWGMSRNLPMLTGETIRMDDDKLRDILESADHPACDWEVLPKHLFGFWPEQSPDQMTFDLD